MNDSGSATGLKLEAALDKWCTNKEHREAIDRWLAIDPEARRTYLGWRLEHKTHPSKLLRPAKRSGEGPALYDVPADIDERFEACTQAQHARAASLTAKLATGELVMRFGQAPADGEPASMGASAWAQKLEVAVTWWCEPVPPKDYEPKAPDNWLNEVHAAQSRARRVLGGLGYSQFAIDTATRSGLGPVGLLAAATATMPPHPWTIEPKPADCNSAAAASTKDGHSAIIAPAERAPTPAAAHRPAKYQWQLLEDRHKAFMESQPAPTEHATRKALRVFGNKMRPIGNPGGKPPSKRHLTKKITEIVKAWNAKNAS